MYKVTWTWYINVNLSDWDYCTEVPIQFATTNQDHLDIFIEKLVDFLNTVHSNDCFPTTGFLTSIIWWMHQIIHCSKIRSHVILKFEKSCSPIIYGLNQRSISDNVWNLEYKKFRKKLLKPINTDFTMIFIWSVISKLSLYKDIFEFRKLSLTTSVKTML